MRPVVVGVDGSLRCEEGVRWAVGEARVRGVPLRRVHVAPSLEMQLPPRVRAQLGGELNLSTNAGVLLVGRVAPTLLAIGATAELVVLGLRGVGGHAGLRLGSVAQAVVASCARPVALVPLRPQAKTLQHRPNKVTLAVDAHNVADAAVDFAFDAAQCRKAAVRALYLGTGSEGPGWERAAGGLLTEALQPWREKYPATRVRAAACRAAAPVEALARASAGSQMLVVGRHHSGALSPMVQALLCVGQCPVVVVPA
ncbi:universal stress protein [Streptomyces kunmingensis]|uniref:Universal stress protein n=2 Tax=Streptomyces kunmingensis TaxID=68225 RepID=A0ABU6CR52_9ACTN|nr:universal stress protein [Streptomyces kunmingensis]MEB3967152.1 universal stress protein [Streptomyces kunmingensis]